MKKQTATEWLIEQVKSPSWSGLFIWHKEEIFQQALTMEKEQIIEAHKDNAVVYEMDANEQAEQYYTSTYGK